MSNASRVEGSRAAFFCRVICADLLQKDTTTAAKVAVGRSFDCVRRAAPHFAQDDFPVSSVKILKGHYTSTLLKNRSLLPLFVVKVASFALGDVQLQDKADPTFIRARSGRRSHEKLSRLPRKGAGEKIRKEAIFSQGVESQRQGSK